ncbi:MAG: asparagine synthase (glutamine-hydrolyzing) [Phycisphaerales bacterium]|jgi:asparagine synthase (glutamine-hydrolysing)
MASLFGILGNSPRELAQGMADALAHRAQIGSTTRIEALPSNAGWFGVTAKNPDDQIGLDSKGRLIACHGEIYAEDQQGRETRETIGSAMDAGPESLEPLDAQFAAVRWEGDSLVVATDSMGTVPLYWISLPGTEFDGGGGGLAFASEYKALLTLPGVTATLDPDMAAYLQHNKSLPMGRTMAKGVHGFGPGLLLKLDPKGKTIGEQSFGSVSAKTTVRNMDEATELIADALRGAVQRRAADLDPVGLCLSGGIDSIAVAFLLRDIFPDRTIHTFCSGSSVDDRECVTARQVAQDIRSVHHEVLTPPEMLATHLEPLAWHLEDPYARSETLQLRECARHAKDAGLDTLLVAQGADDLFAGMPKCRLLWMMKKFPPAARGLWEFYSFTQTNAPPRTMLARAMNRIRYKGRVPVPPAVLGAGFAPEHMAMPGVGPDMINTTLAEQFQGSTHKSAKKMERVFASFGIQYRSPFHDRALARVAYSIDEKLKVTRTEQKHILRETLGRWVPERYIRIPKFPQRMAYNARFAEQIDRVFDEVLNPEAVESLGVFAPADIARLRRTDPNAAYPDEAAMRIWTAALTHLWVRRFVGSEAPAVGRSDAARQAPPILESGAT